MRPVVNDQLPTRKQKLVGTDFEGNRVELIHSISKKLYRCPGCGESIPIGSEHVLIRITEPGARPYHQHWHRACTRQILRELRNVIPKPL
jgi:hypothetical protein